MNLMLRIAGIWALVVTVCKIITFFAVVPGFSWIAQHSAFMLSLAAMIALLGYTKRWWLVIGAGIAVYALLAMVGL